MTEFFGQSLKHLREKMLLNQRDVAQLLGVSVTTVSSWERGVKQPTLRHQRALKTILEPGTERKAGK